MPASSVTVAHGHLNKVDIESPEFIKMVEDAKASNEADALLTVRQALKKYKVAMFWAMLLSVALIMEGFDGNMVMLSMGTSFFPLPPSPLLLIFYCARLTYEPSPR